MGDSKLYRAQPPSPRAMGDSKLNHAPSQSMLYQRHSDTDPHSTLGEHSHGIFQKMPLEIRKVTLSIKKSEQSVCCTINSLAECNTQTQTRNDPSAGSPTETLLRLLLPLNDQVRSSSHNSSNVAIAKAAIRGPH